MQLQDAAGQPLFLNNGQFSGVAGSSLTADGYQFNAVPAGTEQAEHVPVTTAT